MIHKQVVAVEAILKARNLEEAASIAGVSSRTLYRWWATTSFRQEVTAARRRLLERVTGRIVSLAGKAIEALESVLDDPGQLGAAVRVRAAAVVLERVHRAEEEDVLERLEALESRVNAGLTGLDTEELPVRRQKFLSGTSAADSGNGRGHAT